MVTLYEHHKTYQERWNKFTKALWEYTLCSLLWFSSAIFISKNEPFRDYNVIHIHLHNLSPILRYTCFHQFQWVWMNRIYIHWSPSSWCFNQNDLSEIKLKVMKYKGFEEQSIPELCQGAIMHFAKQPAKISAYSNWALLKQIF